jgi:hypothetical protein
VRTLVRAGAFTGAFEAALVPALTGRAALAGVFAGVFVGGLAGAFARLCTDFAVALAEVLPGLAVPLAGAFFTGDDFFAAGAGRLAGTDFFAGTDVLFAAFAGAAFFPAAACLPVALAGAALAVTFVDLDGFAAAAATPVSARRSRPPTPRALSAIVVSPRSPVESRPARGAGLAS